MGRLIDADAFERTVMFGDAEDMQDVIYALRDYPTAYDPDKVVEQLETMRMRYYLTYANTGNKTNDEVWEKASRAMDEAITIVKGGGVDAKTDF